MTTFDANAKDIEPAALTGAMAVALQTAVANLASLRLAPEGRRFYGTDSWRDVALFNGVAT